MRWAGKTKAQLEREQREWHPCFALFPAQMDSGRWIWLETFWRRAVPTINGRIDWQQAESAEEAAAICAEDEARIEQMRAHPPKPTR